MDKYLNLMGWVTFIMVIFISPNSMTYTNKRKGIFKYYSNEKYWQRFGFFFERIKRARKAKKEGRPFDWNKDKEDIHRIIDEMLQKNLEEKKRKFMKECIEGGYYGENVQYIRKEGEEV